MIRSLLEAEFRVSAVIGRGDAVLSTLREHVHDALVLDVSLPGGSGFRLLPMLRAEWPRLGIIMLTTHEDELYRRLTLERGADAYVEKADAFKTLVPAIRLAIAKRREQGRVRAHAELGIHRVPRAPVQGLP